MTKRRLGFEKLDSREMLCAYTHSVYNDDIQSFANTGANDCITVDLNDQDIFVAKLTVTSGSLTNTETPYIELVDDNTGQIAIGSFRPFSGSTLDRLPPDPESDVRDHSLGTAAIVFHAPADGTYTLRANPDAVTGGHSISYITTYRGRPNGSRQYVYLDFNGESLPSNISWNTDPGQIGSLGSFLDSLPANVAHVSSADVDELVGRIVTYMEDRFPALENRLLVLDSQTNSALETKFENDPLVHHFSVGQGSALSFPQGEAQYFDAGNFVWNDHGWFSPYAPEFSNLKLCTHSDAVEACLADQPFQSNDVNDNREAMLSFLTTYLSRMIAHEVGHSLGLNHAFNNDVFLNTRSAMQSGVTGALASLKNNTYQGVSNGSRLDYRWGGFQDPTRNLIVGTGQLFDEFYGLDEMKNRAAEALRTTGKQSGFWYSYLEAELDGASIAAGELVYTGGDQVAEVVLVSKTGDDVTVTVDGVANVFADVTRFRFIGRGGDDTLLYGGMGNIGVTDGDFNDDLHIDDIDIDLLFDAVEAGVYDDLYDLTQDGELDTDDVNYMVHILLSTAYGDANLDGVFDSADLVLVLGVGNYETMIASGWAEGDWNGDDLFGSSDFVVALTNSL